MREILFRAKRRHNNEWVYGNLVYGSGFWASLICLSNSEVIGNIYDS